MNRSCANTPYSFLLLSLIRYATPASVAADARIDNPKCIFLNVDVLPVLMICLPFILVLNFCYGLLIKE